LSVTSAVCVTASHVRWPLKVGGRVIYRLVTDAGDFVSASPPDIFDQAGAPTSLPAELAAGSIVRIETNAHGAMVSIQLVGPIYDNPFGET
jgi:hypothetical protein